MLSKIIYLMKNVVNKSKFIVTGIKKETADVITIYLSPTTHGLDYKAGQYVTVYLDKNKNSHGKFYTISSSPAEKTLALSVKKIGQFSSALHNLKIKDIVYLSGPFGCFYPEIEMSHVVFLAAGIGVTPFLSVMKDYSDKNIKKEIDLYYTNKSFQDIAFCEDINELAKNKSLRVHYHLTRDQSKQKLISNYERIKAENIKKELGGFTDKYFYICGPITFVSDLRKQLLKLKVKEDCIFTESFY